MTNHPLTRKKPLWEKKDAVLPTMDGELKKCAPEALLCRRDGQYFLAE